MLCFINGLWLFPESISLNGIYSIDAGGAKRKNKQLPKFFFIPSRALKLLRQICQWEEREAVFFMLELTWETDKTLLYGSAIPFMYNI